MSSELRVKKLRGSGGYVIASVTDDQQRKGNLGGPDLFLAPVGRLDPESVSRYFCNTCEKDYEGCPKIEYESPNEAVADNLVLAERGQYACSTCGSAIAEYREFTKPDEQADVGLARPMGAPAPRPAAQQQPAPQPAAPRPAPGAARPIAGMAVFDENGVRVGTAGQVGVDASQNVVLTVSTAGGADEEVPWDRVGKIGEIILLGGGGPGAGPQAGKAEAPAAAACPGCGFSNRAGSKFCEQCGGKL